MFRELNYLKRSGSALIYALTAFLLLAVAGVVYAGAGSQLDPLVTRGYLVMAAEQRAQQFTGASSAVTKQLNNLVADLQLLQQMVTGEVVTIPQLPVPPAVPAQPAASQPSRQKMEVIVAGAILRQGPGITYARLTVLPRGSVVSVLEQRNDWFRVQTTGGGEGWLRQDLIQEAP